MIFSVVLGTVLGIWLKRKFRTLYMIVLWNLSDAHISLSNKKCDFKAILPNLVSYYFGGASFASSFLLLLQATFISVLFFGFDYLKSGTQTISDETEYNDYHLV